MLRHAAILLPRFGRFHQLQLLNKRLRPGLPHTGLLAALFGRRQKLFAGRSGSQTSKRRTGPDAYIAYPKRQPPVQLSHSAGGHAVQATDFGFPSFLTVRYRMASTRLATLQHCMVNSDLREPMRPSSTLGVSAQDSKHTADDGTHGD